LSRDSNFFALHLAGHGEHPTNEPLSAALVLGKRETDKLDALAALHSSLHPQFVFQSACVVGRTTEDIDGDPLGLVSASFMRSARYIIAPIQPVNDFYMPLLVCLFYQTWLQQTTPHYALKEAKHRLKTGEWHPNTEELIRNSYFPVLMSHLQSNMRRRRAIKRVVETWPIPSTFKPIQEDVDVRKTNLEKIQQRLRSDFGYHAQFVNVVLTSLFENKQCLPIDDLCVWVRGFGWFGEE
jgi:CHAT domain-containing protein